MDSLNFWIWAISHECDLLFFYLHSVLLLMLEPVLDHSCCITHIICVPMFLSSAAVWIVLSRAQVKKHIQCFLFHHPVV